MNNALILVDLQNDFVPGGALAVPDGDSIISLANRLCPLFDLVIATQDWHPPHHGSFASQHPGKKPGDRAELNGMPQVLWPDHCVQGTQGARLVDGFDTSHLSTIFHKGVEPDIDSYSTFFDNAHRRDTGLAGFLRKREVTEVFFAGLATDYCIKYSVLDSCWLHFNTYVVADACRGINLQPGDVDRSLRLMRAAGAHIVLSEQVPGLVDHEISNRKR